jgi:hypothetical protein
MARAIAVAAGHPLGAGDARYRIGSQSREVETVPFGAFYRQWYDRVGRFDESLLSNEDYEFNHRLRLAGGRIWFDPSIRSMYFARKSYSALLRQYIRYGFWKARMLGRYPRSLRWRQALPPIFVLMTLILGLSALGGFQSAGILLGLQWGSYTLILFAVGTRLAWRRKDPPLVLGFPLAVAGMHLAWGTAFLWGMVRAFVRSLSLRPGLKI